MARTCPNHDCGRKQVLIEPELGGLDLLQPDADLPWVKILVLSSMSAQPRRLVPCVLVPSAMFPRRPTSTMSWSVSARCSPASAGISRVLEAKEVDQLYKS